LRTSGPHRWQNTEDEQLRTNGEAITQSEQAAICSIVWFADVACA